MEGVTGRAVTKCPGARTDQVMVRRRGARDGQERGVGEKGDGGLGEGC